MAIDDPVHLRHFRPEEILLSSEDAEKVLKFYFGSNVPNSAQLTPNDVEFAQALLLEGIDKSYAMGYVKIIFDTFFMKVPGSFDSIKDMVKDFAKKAAKHWFDHASGKDLASPKIYESVRTLIRANFGTSWTIRNQTGELTY